MAVCKLCGSERAIEYRQVISPVNSLEYTFFRCKKCKSGFFIADEHPVNLQETYESFVTRADFPLEFVPSIKWQKEKLRVEKYLKHDLTSILDVGCRTGDFLMHFPDTISREGVELSSKFHSKADKRGLKVYNDFLEKISFTKSYDVVTCYAILEHLEYPLIFFDSLTSLVNKDGLLIIMIPTFQSLKEKILNILNKPWHMFSPPEHLNFYSRKFLDSYLKKNGFEKVFRVYSSGGMQFFNSGILSEIEKYLTVLIDKSFLSKLPIFDHMYSYYVNKQ
ncbi:hypothetical protein ES705_29316 [subsurface metagenome]